MKLVLGGSQSKVLAVFRQSSARADYYNVFWAPFTVMGGPNNINAFD
jgi:hypothetical protein